MLHKTIMCQEDITSAFLRVWRIRAIENPIKFFTNKSDITILNITNRQHINELLNKRMSKEDLKKHMKNDLAEQNMMVYTTYIKQQLPALENIRTTEVDKTRLKKHFQELTVSLKWKDEWVTQYMEQIVWLNPTTN